MASVEELRGKTLSNTIWKLAERIGAQLVSFIVQIVLARLLMPENFGTIAIINVFIAIGNVFITNGLGTSLIQKKDADELDFSTVFFFNIILSICLYGLLFAFTPLIAKLYDNMELVLVIRILGLQLLLSGVKTVQQAYVARNLKFRLFFWATLIGTVISGFVGIGLAYAGMGAWALVAQHLTNSTIDMIMLFLMVKWRPKMLFSKQRLTPLLSYGWKLMAAALLDTIYNNIRTLIIGLKYSKDDLAYYNRGKQFPDLVSDNVMISIESVLFPVMSRMQDSKEEVKRIVRRFIITCSYIMVPMLFGLAVVAKPLVSILLTDKWLFCVPYIQIYCGVSALRPMQTANIQMIKAVGRSDITVKIEIIKKVIGLIIILISMQFGVIWIAASNILYSLIVLVINARPSKQLIDYGYLEQLKDLLPAIAASLGMAVIAYSVSFLGLSNGLTLILQVVVGVLSYLLLSIIFRMESYTYIVSLIKGFRNQHFTGKIK